MRFSARSLSPSPVRHSTFGVHSGDDTSDTESSLTSDSDSFCYQSESEVPYPPPRPKRLQRSPPEQRYIEETIAAIRLRTRYHDPYEEWERQTRKDAFHTALKEQAAARSALHDSQVPPRTQFLACLTAHHARQLAEVEQALAAIKLRHTSEENKMKEAWKAGERRLRERVENGIKYEEDKMRAKLEAERKVREEVERKRQEEERKRQEEERRRRESEEKKRAEEERARSEVEAKRKAEEEKRVKEEEEKERIKRREAAEKERRGLGFTSIDEDWRHARETLLKLKSEDMKSVKGNSRLKSTWNTLRRQIKPKIGQLTADPAVIARISNQLLTILLPTPPHPPPIYHALLSSLSKCILLQAETEVTAEKRSAQPLALVTASLLGSLDGFAEVLYAKLGQRAGGWVIPCVVPETDVGGRKWGPGEREKAMGYRGAQGDIESPSEYITRVAGLMRVYFAIMRTPVGKPLHRMFQVPRYWVWFARIMGEAGLLETAVAPQLIYVALDVFGPDARGFWGQQWIKMLALLYEGVTVGIGGGSGDARLIGGQTAEGKAGRVRVQLEVERIMKDG